MLVAAPNKPVEGAAAIVVVVAAVPPNELVPPKLNEDPKVVGWVDEAEAPNVKGDDWPAGGFVVPVPATGVENENGLFPPNILGI